jgi:hypothetical protein
MAVVVANLEKEKKKKRDMGELINEKKERKSKTNIQLVDDIKTHHKLEFGMLNNTVGITSTEVIACMIAFVK